MVLSKTAIKKAIEANMIAITPFSDEQLEAAHVNLHLGGSEVMDDGRVVLLPKSSTLAQTKERITLSAAICGSLEGRSKLAQKGISIEQSSTFVEPGASGTMVLEIFNASDQIVELKRGDKIAKLILFKVTDDI